MSHIIADESKKVGNQEFQLHIANVGNNVYGSIYRVINGRLVIWNSWDGSSAEILARRAWNQLP